MKRSFFAILTAVFSFTGCGDDIPAEAVETAPVVAEDSIKTIQGDFIFVGQEAVLKGSDFIYGVEIDSISMKLADSVAPLKTDEFHMIPVVVEGEIIKNPRRDGWEEILLIREIVEISPEANDSADPQVKKDLDKP